MISKISSLNEYKILVTGACGFLGSHLVKGLLDNRAFVVGIDENPRFPEHLAEAIKNHSFRFIQGSFLQKAKEALAELQSENRSKTAILHMAGIAQAGECEKNPEKAFESHVLLTLRVLEFCRQNKIGKFVYPSSGLVYGDYRRRPVTEETSPSSQNIYTASKLSAEALIMGYSKSYEIPCIIVRLGNVYGPGGHEDTVVSTIINQIRAGQRIVVRDLTPIRDFIYINDAIEGLIRLLISSDKQECPIVNLSTGIGTSVFNLVKTASRLSPIFFGDVQTNSDSDLPNSTLILDNTLLKKLTGWEPRYSLSEGLSLTLKAYNQKDALE